jgi:hypothetical protein
MHAAPCSRHVRRDHSYLPLAPAILLRESYREGARVRNRTLAGLSHWPRAQIEALRARLRSRTVAANASGVEIMASRAHGQVQVVTLAMQRLAGCPR